LRQIDEIGLGHLTLDRAAGTLSAGQSRRLQLVAALGTKLVNTLCVLDEPTAGMHRTEVGCVVRSAGGAARDAGNTLVVVEHDTAVIAARRLRHRRSVPARVPKVDGSFHKQ
jgi:excinuclease ABC subunit A